MKPERKIGVNLSNLFITRVINKAISYLTLRYLFQKTKVSIYVPVHKLL